MTESKEHLSCLMDGELEPQAQRFLLRRLADDAGMSATWRRYHLVRACLHQEMSSAGCIAKRVSAALDSEPLPSIERTMPRWFKPLAGSAIAASAALFAIVAINNSLLERTQPGLQDDQPGFVAQPTVLDQPFSQQPVPVGFNEVSPADRQRINTYVLRHNQAASGSGFVSYLPIVTGTYGEAAPRPPESLEQEQPARED